jgi:hypothetical protein
MKLLIIMLLLVLSSCSQKQAQPIEKPIEKPMVMGSTYPSYVTTATFKDSINNLRIQVTAATQATANAINQLTALQKQVNTNQSQMYDGFHEFYIRTDKLDSLRIASNSDTLGVDIRLGKIIQLRKNYQLITIP